jgi:hypothetical protein
MNYSVSLWLLYVVFRAIDRKRGRVRGFLPSLEAHSLSGVIRWLELYAAEDEKGIEVAVPDSGISETDALKKSRCKRLLEHSSVDAKAGLCPCPLPACSGNLPVRLVYVSLLLTLISTPCQVLSLWGAIYTPTATFSIPLWESPWAVTGAAYLIMALVYLTCVELNRFMVYNAVTLKLALKLHRRAVKLSLSSFLGYAAVALKDNVDMPSNAADLHVTLHTVLSAVWQARMDQTAVYRTGVISFLLASALLNLILFTSTGSCLPAFVLGVFGVVLVFTVQKLITQLNTIFGVRPNSCTHRQTVKDSKRGFWGLLLGLACLERF